MHDGRALVYGKHWFSVYLMSVNLIAQRSAKGHLRTCSGGKSLVCFYQESGPNRSRAGGGSSVPHGLHAACSYSASLFAANPYGSHPPYPQYDSIAASRGVTRAGPWPLGVSGGASRGALRVYGASEGGRSLAAMPGPITLQSPLRSVKISAPDCQN